MPDLNKIYLFRMLHIDNMQQVLLHGITHRNSPNANVDFVPIGDVSLISNRDTFAMPNGKIIGDYIPFYFWARMPMLFVIQNGFNGVQSTPALQIVYCVSSIAQMLSHQLGFVFTDGHAVDSFSTFHNENDVSNIDTILDFDAIKSKFWKDDKDLDKKRRKEAEFLVKEDVPITAIVGYICFDETAKTRLVQLGIEEGLVAVKPDFYFKI